MKSVRELHTRAMELAQQAGAACQQGNDARGKELFKRASRVEADAAGRIELTEKNEPTRSILYNSAASLAAKGEDFELALQLAECGLQGYPSPRITDSLNKILDSIAAKRDTFLSQTTLSAGNDSNPKEIDEQSSDHDISGAWQLQRTFVGLTDYEDDLPFTLTNFFQKDVTAIDSVDANLIDSEGNVIFDFLRNKNKNEKSKRSDTLDKSTAQGANPKKNKKM